MPLFYIDYIVLWAKVFTNKMARKHFVPNKKFFLKTLFLVVFEFLEILRERPSPWAFKVY